MVLWWIYQNIVCLTLHQSYQNTRDRCWQKKYSPNCTQNEVEKLNSHKKIMKLPLLLVYPWFHICWCTPVAVSCMFLHDSVNYKSRLREFWKMLPYSAYSWTYFTSTDEIRLHHVNCKSSLNEFHPHSI